jgi:ribosome-binding factor A
MFTQGPEKAPSQRQTKVSLEILALVQDFFQRESSGLSLITITRCEVSPDMRQGTIYMTVLPVEKEQAALDFARRMRTDMRKYVMKRLPVKVIPFFEIEIDYGEKNRQHIDEILRNEKQANKEYQEKHGIPEEANKETEEE